MHKFKLFIVVLLAQLWRPLHSQKITYGGMHQYGLNFGENGVNSSFNFLNGIRYSKFFSGIGVHYEGTNYNRWINYYNSTVNYSTVAFYANQRYYINKKKNFFAKADAGVNIINTKLSNNNYEKFKKQPGYYCAAGLGFKAKLGKEVYYSFDLSYAVKQTKYDHERLSFQTGDWMWTKEKFNALQYRILLNIGIEIF